MIDNNAVEHFSDNENINKLENEFFEIDELQDDSFDFDRLQNELELKLEDQFSDLDDLEKDFENIGNFDNLGDTIGTLVWEQFVNQVGVVAGEDFIKENRGLKLDLRNSSHIQTTENFSKGKIAIHNSEINFQERYDTWQTKFRKDENGDVITHNTRTGKQEATLASGARNNFDIGRPTGSKLDNTDMDHIVSAGEIIRNADANAHLSVEQQVAFANSYKNLNEMDAGQNRSKSDLPMNDWLDNPNKNGQKPNEIFDIDDNLDKDYRAKDKKAREEFQKEIKDGQDRSIKTGKQSQKKEAFRIGGKALRSVIMVLFSELVKSIIQKLIKWFKVAEKNISNLIAYLKDSIMDFLKNLKEHLKNVGDVLFTTIATAIFGPIVGLLKKSWLILKKGYESLKQAINYIKDPINRKQDKSILMFEVSKIIIAGITAGGAIILGDVIEKGLMAVPIFAAPIPLLGSLASLLGIFFGAVGSGIIGALALHIIDKIISDKQKSLIIERQINTNNEILDTQNRLITISTENLVHTKQNVSDNITARHKLLSETIAKSKQITLANEGKNENTNAHKEDFDNIFDLLNK